MIRLCYLVPVIFFFIFCHKIEEENPFPTVDVEFMVNGDTCPGTSWAIVDPGVQRSFHISIDKEGQGANGYHLIFSGVSRNVGKYQISEDSFPDSFLTVNRGGDVILASYRPLYGKDNFIRIDSVSENYRHIQGAFEVTFIVSTGVSDFFQLPDTIMVETSFFESIVRDSE